jgi:CheY-like chemotaxis protein
VSAANGKNGFELVRKPSSAVEKAAPSAKRILSGMVGDTLALIKFQNQFRVVVVDDEPEILGIMEDVIPGWFKKATVLTFRSGDKAWEELQREDPDILITDILRPDDVMNGWVMIPLLAEKKVKYPIVVISGFTEFPVENADETTKAASVAFHNFLEDARQTLNITTLTKPFDFEELRKLLEASLIK